MTEPNPFERRFGNTQLGPYAHPEYWDGQYFGQNNAARLPADSLPPLLGTKHLVQQSLETYLDADGPRATLKRYAAGDVFDPGDYSPGTIVAMKRDHLAVPAKRVIMDFDGVQPATPNTILPPT